MKKSLAIVCLISIFTLSAFGCGSSKNEKAQMRIAYFPEFDACAGAHDQKQPDIGTGAQGKL